MRSRAHLTAFLRQPYAVYREYPRWVAPLEAERRRFLDPRSNPYLRRGNAAYFLAQRGSETVGRVVALVDPDGPEDRREGHLGFFECADDPSAAQALFDSGTDWLRTQAVRTVIGPMSPNAHHECGLLVEGFDDAPLIGIPYNPPYYEELFTSNHFVPVKDLLSWRVPTGSTRATQVIRYADAVSGRNGLRVRPADFRRFAAESALVRDLYNECWRENWGFAPMTEAEFVQLARTVRKVAPDGVRILEADGRAAGFSVLLPDLNQALAPARGRLTRAGWPSGAWRVWRAQRAVNRGRLMALGVPDALRRRGAGSVLVADALAQARQSGWDDLDVSWILADNEPANRGIATAGGVVHKRHRLYGRCLVHNGDCACLAPDREA
ncbi:GNAT family N-acetyltransferase [Streptomyces sp. NPDC051183]|uniref:GNAT family N-acetyltransferase n=1 Tax=unclassified Streptomyces TaxID=2593676 RepID=UPI00342BFBF5